MSIMLSDFTGVPSLRRLPRGLMTVASGEHQVIGLSMALVENFDLERPFRLYKCVKVYV